MCGYQAAQGDRTSLGQDQCGVQELIDVLQYVQAVRMKSQGLGPIKPLLALLTQLS